MRHCDEEHEELYTARAARCATEILQYHHKPELGATLETVGLNGEFWSGISDGRVINPGHSIECSWFLLEEALYTNNTEMLRQAVEMFDFACAKGWDNEYGGLLYYVDALGNPPEAYEHDMKLWWPHNEMLIASLMIYTHTQDEKYLDWFVRCFAYATKVFGDSEYGEWWGYLRRDGKPTSPPAKGSTFKGPFHLPRMLVMLDDMLTALEAK